MKLPFRFFLMLLFIISCHSPEWESQDVVLKQNPGQIKEPNHTSTNVAMKKWLEQLTSPKFFEYTQAARIFLDMGVDAIPYLLENIHLMRESNDSVTPVCQNLIEIIFQQQKEEWILSQTKSPHPEIQKIAKEEMARREKLK